LGKSLSGYPFKDGRPQLHYLALVVSLRLGPTFFREQNTQGHLGIQGFLQDAPQGFTSEDLKLGFPILGHLTLGFYTTLVCQKCLSL